MEGGANPSSSLRFPLPHTIGAQGSSLLLSIVSTQENQMMLCLANLEEMTIKGEVYLSTWDLFWLFFLESVFLIQTLEVREAVLSAKRQKILTLQMLQMSINSLDVAKLSGHSKQK